MKPFVFLLGLIPALGFAIEPQISAELSNRSAFLGDQVTLKVRIHHDDGWQFPETPISEELGEGKVLSQTWQGPTKQEGTDLNLMEFQAQIAWYSFGEFKLPPIAFSGVRPDGTAKEFNTPELTIEIQKMLDEEDQDLAPPKDQVALEIPAYWPWILLAVVIVILIILAIVFFLKKRKKPVAVKPIRRLPPDQEALERLQKLTHGPLLKEGKIKPFYVEINLIIRAYYARLYGINAEEMTSFELEEWIVSQRTLPASFPALNQTFQDHCDRVKFAKHDPVEAENKEVVNWAYQIVALLKPAPEETHVATG